MTARDRSLSAYRKLRGSGVRNTQAYKLLKAMNPGKSYTRSELRVSTGITVNAVSGRINELVKAGFLLECSERKCHVTGWRCHTVMRPYAPSLHCDYERFLAA